MVEMDWDEPECMASSAVAQAVAEQAKKPKDQPGCAIVCKLRCPTLPALYFRPDDFGHAVPRLEVKISLKYPAIKHKPRASIRFLKFLASTKSRVQPEKAVSPRNGSVA